MSIVSNNVSSISLQENPTATQACVKQSITASHQLHHITGLKGVASSVFSLQMKNIEVLVVKADLGSKVSQ